MIMVRFTSKYPVSRFAQKAHAPTPSTETFDFVGAVFALSAGRYAICFQYHLSNLFTKHHREWNWTNAMEMNEKIAASKNSRLQKV